MEQYTKGDNGAVKQIITKEYKGRFSNDYVEVTCFIQS